MLQARENFALVYLNGRVLAVGGYEAASLSSVECYDPFKNKWEFVAPMNLKRHSHSAAIHKNRLFVLGGIARVMNVNDSIEYYDPTVDKWTMVQAIDN